MRGTPCGAAALQRLMWPRELRASYGQLTLAGWHVLRLCGVSRSPKDDQYRPWIRGREDEKPVRSGAEWCRSLRSGIAEMSEHYGL